MSTYVFNDREYATDKELVEAVAATLELPSGLVDDEQLGRWREGLPARGWTIGEQTDTHYRLEHTSSGFLADLRLLQFDPTASDYPVLDAATEPHPEQLRPAFNTARLSAPSDHGLLADANLTTASSGDPVVWLITHTGPAHEDATDDTATASPFAGGSRQRSASESLGSSGAAALRRLRARPALVAVLAGGVLLIAAAVLLLRRSNDRRLIEL